MQNKTKKTKGISLSVRGMQFILDITVNAKIPEELVDKKSFECFRIWPCGLIRSIAKIWHFLEYFCNICNF